MCLDAYGSEILICGNVPAVYCYWFGSFSTQGVDWVLRFTILVAIAACALAQTVETITPEPLITSVTVSSERGTVQPVTAAAHVVNVVDRVRLLSAPYPTLGNALERMPNVLVQQTTQGQVSPFLRGFTGYHVLNLVDGIRFNNSTFRSGPNQYLAFLEPSQSSAVEAVLGPTGSQFGSDALGGTIHVLTPEIATSDTRRWFGEVAAFGAIADYSKGGEARTGFSSPQFSWIAGASAADHNDLRAGAGEDSRNVFRRLFGLDGGQTRNLLGSRLSGTGFSRYSGFLKSLWRPSDRDGVTLWYQASELSGVRGYKDLLGGLGRLQSEFSPQRMHFFYTRYERQQAGWFDTISGTFSINSQRDGSTRHGLRLSDAVTRDDVTVDAFGYSAQAAGRAWNRNVIVFGGEIYDEHIEAIRFTASERVRPLYPSGARYTTSAAWGQMSSEYASRRVRVTVGGRLTGVGFQSEAAKQTFRDATFHATALWQPRGQVGFHAIISRGFRAPNLNDLASIGLNDLGYEIPASEAVGALLGSSAGESALPANGRSIRPLGAETLMNYEAGLRFQTQRLYVRAQVFHAGLRDSIDRRTLLFPEGNVPSQLAGIPVTPIPQTPEQRSASVVAVATALDPRALKAFVNDGRSRYYGGEALGEWKPSTFLSVRANYSYLHGRVLDPNRPVRRLPPQQGAASVMYAPSSRPFWIEAAVTCAGSQTRLSGGDLDDERIGASRSRNDITAFFAGARAADFVKEGIFTPTGESLTAIQSRVLPRTIGDTTRVPLYWSTSGWAAFDLRGGWRLSERTTLYFGINNILDRNYRTHGSGVDAPGVNPYARAHWRF
jgi:outer membrane receptor protein involved in Fe transport